MDRFWSSESAALKCSGDVSAWLRFFPMGTTENVSSDDFTFTMTLCIASNALWGFFFLSHVFRKMIENQSGCAEWAEVSFRDTALWEVLVFPQVFGGFPSPPSLRCKPASPHRWWTSLFGRCSYIWRLLLPTAARLSGQNAFQECRGTLYFTLSQNNRSFPARCGPERLIGACQAPGREHRLQERLASKGGELYEVDELLGRWFQSGCKPKQICQLVWARTVTECMIWTETCVRYLRAHVRVFFSNLGEGLGGDGSMESESVSQWISSTLWSRVVFLNHWIHFHTVIHGRQLLQLWWSPWFCCSNTMLLTLAVLG